MTMMMGRKEKTKQMGADGRPRARIILTAEQAMEIYGLKPAPRSDLLSKQQRTRGLSLPIAKQYGVSPKTIRDIWNRRTWAFATVCLLPANGVKDKVECEVFYQFREQLWFLLIIVFSSPIWSVTRIEDVQEDRETSILE
jgi:hypothetical protein